MKKLLLADDSITIQKVVGIIFSTEEYQLEVTDDGDRAFTKALEELPDLVIADISMPGKDGFELCRAIKNEPSLSNTSVLLLPGAFDHFDEIKAGEVCADGWLTKPFESQALLDKVSQLLAAEPVRMAGVVTAAAEELPAETQSGTSEMGADSVVDEAVLGLGAVDALATPAEDVDEESPDDIWDTVSFAEDDLQVQPEPAEVDFADEDLQEQVEPAAVDSADEDLQEQVEPAAVDFAEDVPFAEDVIEPATDEQVLSAFTVDDDAILELQEEDEQVEPESIMQETIDSSDSTSDLGETVSDDSSDDGDIYDLSEEDIVESEPLEEVVAEAAIMEPETVVAVEPEPLDDVSDLVEEDVELAEEEIELAEEEIELAEEEIELAEEEIELTEEEIELTEDTEPVSIDAEDEAFYFDETIEDDNDIAMVTAGTVGMTAEVAAVSFDATAAEGSATEQVEQQLRELSEDELREVVSKVARPIIEKLASEMLEKIAWEVVPDLAEAMISEEIRKIKEGT